MRRFLAISTLLFGLAIAGQAQNQYPNGYYGPQQNWRAVMNAHDQQEFDKEYSKWAEATRKNDRDDIAEHARKMQDIMVRYNIPVGTPFDLVATNGVPVNGVPANSPYPGVVYNTNGAYPANAYGQVRLSSDDQHKFDKAYDKWLEAQRKNDRDDIDGAARDMQNIMARNNIPVGTPFAAIATNGNAGAYVNGAPYPNGAYPNGTAYPSNAPYGYAYPQGAQRLNSKDQEEFDKAYHHWVDSRRKRDMDDVDKNARKMQEIMARYNIPANVSFDAIATPGSAYR